MGRPTLTCAMALTVLALCICTQARKTAPAAAAVASTAGAMKTQGKCACVAKWTYKYNATSSVALSGCANPDQDPKGNWCPVSKDCEGLYGKFTHMKETIHFDYCGDVRAVTESGCICNAVTDMTINPGLNQLKNVYDGCGAQNKYTHDHWCYVNNKTCTKPLDKEDYFRDYCKTQSKPAVINLAPDGTPKTQSGCACLKNWKFLWPMFLDGSTDPMQGCYSDDGDPKGSWCPVNPLECPGAYGYFTQESKRIYYDYCNNVTDFTRNGCRCKPIWGGGKLMDRCANPDGKPGGKWCEIMPDTCTKGTPEGADWDYCGPAPRKTPTGVGSAPGNSTATNTSTSATASSNTKSTSPGEAPIVVVAAPPSDAKADKSRRYVYIIVPLLTGLAAIVTISYTLYKCHKKRKFFKSTQIMKIQQFSLGSGITGTGSSLVPAGSAQPNLAPQSTNGTQFGYAPSQYQAPQLSKDPTLSRNPTLMPSSPTATKYTV